MPDPANTELGGWRVGRLAEATGVTVRTLHHYEDVGLLVPSGRSEAGHRVYGDADIRRLYRVMALRALGMKLAEIRKTAGSTTAPTWRRCFAHTWTTSSSRSTASGRCVTGSPVSVSRSMRASPPTTW